MTNLLNKISNSFEIRAAAKINGIHVCEQYFKFTLPEDYKKFLLFSNGLEGEGKNGYLVLWSVEELLELNDAYNVKEFIQNTIIFGSDGEEDAYAFDTTNNKIIRLPFVGMGHIPSKKIAETFQQFLSDRLLD